jgi:uncharacterized glyoxalase superfamily protein PhnB
MPTQQPDTPPAPKRATPESLRALELTASLTVNDLQRSLAWYRDIVGFTVDKEYDREGVLRAVALKAGSVRVLLGQDDGAKGWDRSKGEGISLQITTSQSIDWIADRIRERGGEIEMEPTDTPWGARVMRLRDPDGFRLVVSSEVKT